VDALRLFGSMGNATARASSMTLQIGDLYSGTAISRPNNPSMPRWVKLDSITGIAGKIPLMAQWGMIKLTSYCWQA
jgi:hypothetical protein